MSGISIREYAENEGISLGTAYRRVWEGRASATKRDGRWVILTGTPGRNPDSVERDGAEN